MHCHRGGIARGNLGRQVSPPLEGPGPTAKKKKKDGFRSRRALLLKNVVHTNIGSKGRIGYEYVDTTYLLGFELEEGCPAT